MGGKRVAFALMVLIATGAWAATDRPVVEIHPVVDCNSNPLSAPFALSVPYPASGCIGRDVIIGGGDVIQARHTKVRFNGKDADALILTLSVTGRQRLFQFTLNHVRDGIAIVIDGRTIEAPIIREPFVSSTVQIVGELSGAEIDALVERFQAQQSNFRVVPI